MSKGKRLGAIYGKKMTTATPRLPESKGLASFSLRNNMCVEGITQQFSCLQPALPGLIISSLGLSGQPRLGSSYVATGTLSLKGNYLSTISGWAGRKNHPYLTIMVPSPGGRTLPIPTVSSGSWLNNNPFTTIAYKAHTYKHILIKMQHFEKRITENSRSCLDERTLLECFCWSWKFNGFCPLLSDHTDTQDANE